MDSMLNLRLAATFDVLRLKDDFKTINAHQSAMTIHSKPWFTEQTYAEARTFMLPTPEMPATYQEWFDIQTKRLTELEAKGDKVEKIEINPNEFARYCEQRQCKHDTVALCNFMFVKGSGKI